MTFSHTQISQYLRCPRSYRYRYLDGWREKETRAAMAFGRCFEKALTAYFVRRGLHGCAIQGMGRFSRRALRIQKGRILGSARSPGCPFARAIRTGRSRQDLPSGTGSASEDGPQSAKRQRIRRLYRCPRRTRWYAMSDRLENYDQSLFRRTSGIVVTRSPDDLLFLDQRNFRMSRLLLLSERAFLKFST